MLKALIISSASAQAPDLLKALVILSDTAVRKSAVNWGKPKAILEFRKKATFVHVINNPNIKFFK